MADIYWVFSMQQLCRIAATMAQSESLPLDMESYDQNVRSVLWRFGAPEYYALALIVSVAVSPYILVSVAAHSVRLLPPALVAPLSIANLVPLFALILLSCSIPARRPTSLHTRRHKARF